MGIDGLYKFINKNCPNIYNTIGIYDIKDKSCIIDGIQHIYTQLIYMRSKNKEVITKDNKNISHIHGLINSLTYYLKYGLIPIFIFDGKSPDIKRKKIEERKNTLKQNLKKLKELENLKNNIDNNINNIIKNQDVLTTSPDLYQDLIGTSPPDFVLDTEIERICNIEEEYKKIYKKSIILKDYFITDWINILELLGLPVIKADGEADPLCAHILKNNPNIYGIISDDSDMLIFGAPILMRKTINQQFTIIELNKLIEAINNLLFIDNNTNDYANDYENVANNNNFTFDNLIEFSILLGTDYANFNLQKEFSNSLELLKYYIKNGLDSIIFPEDKIKFNIIKKYYQNYNFDNSYNYILNKPEWIKPKLMELKQILLELDVDEEYIDKNNQIFDHYYIKYQKRLNFSKSLNNTTYKFYDNNMLSHSLPNYNFSFLPPDKNYFYEYKNYNYINNDNDDDDDFLLYSYRKSKIKNNNLISNNNLSNSIPIINNKINNFLGTKMISNSYPENNYKLKITYI